MFMEPDIRFGRWHRIETREGTMVLPEDCGADIGSAAAFAGIPADTVDMEQSETIEAWGARLSAPGYLDATEWSLSDTLAEACAELRTMYNLSQCPACGAFWEPEGEDTPEVFPCEDCESDAGPEDTWAAALAALIAEREGAK